jgi:hypothetical protein
VVSTTAFNKLVPRWRPRQQPGHKVTAACVPLRRCSEACDFCWQGGWEVEAPAAGEPAAPFTDGDGWDTGSQLPGGSVHLGLAHEGEGLAALAAEVPRAAASALAGGLSCKPQGLSCKPQGHIIVSSANCDCRTRLRYFTSLGAVPCQ